LVLADSPLEKVGLSLQRNHFHPIEGVLAVPDFSHSQCYQKTIGNAFNVLNHELNKKRATLLLIPMRSVGRLSEMNFFSI
jgi:hypothetical protein